MFRTAKQLEGYSLHAKDGEIGHVTDLYFETLHWGLRYFVVDAGSWLKQRSVLISPEAIYMPEWDRRLLPVDLTRDEVRDSPGIETDKPVSRQYEEALRRHYNWPPYWGAVDGGGTAGFPPEVPILPAQPREELELKGDPHLFSVNAVVGHHVAADDGEIGHVEDVLVDAERWIVRYFVVATRNWWPGKKVLLSPWWSSDLDWPRRRITMDLKRDTIRNSPPYDPEKTFTAEASGELHDYYGSPRHRTEQSSNPFAKHR